MAALGRPRLLCDRMLGRLARWLRLLGFDAPLVEKLPPRPAPGEFILTRRTAWQGREGAVFIRHDILDNQIRQVVKEGGLSIDPQYFFSRCLDCNLPVEPFDREAAADRVPDHVMHTAPCFHVCPGCGKVFWPGSHTERALLRLESILGVSGEGHLSGPLPS